RRRARLDGLLVDARHRGRPAARGGRALPPPRRAGLSARPLAIARTRPPPPAAACLLACLLACPPPPAAACLLACLPAPRSHPRPLRLPVPMCRFAAVLATISYRRFG